MACGYPDGGEGVWTPLKNHKAIGFSKQYCPGSPEKSQSYQVSIQCWAIIGPPVSQHSMLGYHQTASETPFQWPMMARF